MRAARLRLYGHPGALDNGKQHCEYEEQEQKRSAGLDAELWAGCPDMWLVRWTQITRRMLESHLPLQMIEESLNKWSVERSAMTDTVAPTHSEVALGCTPKAVGAPPTDKK